MVMGLVEFSLEYNFSGIYYFGLRWKFYIAIILMN